MLFIILVGEKLLTGAIIGLIEVCSDTDEVVGVGLDSGVGADSVPPQILSPRTQSASGNCPPRT